MSDPITLCFGCRAVTDAPRVPDDNMPTEAHGKWEEFVCERCGVTDVRLVSEPTGRGEPGTTDNGSVGATDQHTTSGTYTAVPERTDDDDR